MSGTYRHVKARFFTRSFHCHVKGESLAARLQAAAVKYLITSPGKIIEWLDEMMGDIGLPLFLYPLAAIERIEVVHMMREGKSRV